LLGAEIEAPCTTTAARQAMFTNELGINNRIRFLKNIAGLWLVQELRRDLSERGQAYNYAELTGLADSAEEFGSIIDTFDPQVQAPGGMIDKISDYCRRTRQSIPSSPGELARCCLESLAVAYQWTFEKLRSVLARDFEVVHIVGGGGQNQLLCQMAADSLQRTVVVGPFEATAIGNGLSQALALGRISDLEELRGIVARSEKLVTYRPSGDERWNRRGELLNPSVATG
jgi:rhamnulokinase